MKEKRIYYNNSYINSFEATVSELYRDNSKNCLVLDKTAFYPESGGQPCDFGTIDGISVPDVFEREDGEIIHIVSEPGDFKTGDKIYGKIDCERRFDHMQQHTGQHVLSGVFMNDFSSQTVGFHLGKTFSTIDLDNPDLSPDKIIEAEKKANKILFENRHINIKYMEEKDAKDLLRKEIERDGLYRVIEIEGFDLSACGGTHCKNTGEVGLILIKGLEKLKNKLRIEFYCGFRALSLFRDYDLVMGEISKKFSVGYQDLVSKMDKLVADNKNYIKNLKILKEKSIEGEIENIYNSAMVIKNKIRYIKGFYKDKNIQDLKSLARSIEDRFNDTVLFLATDSDPVNILVTRTKDVNINLVEIMKSFSKDYSGKGGGKPDFFQGGGYKPDDIKKLLIEFENRLINLL